MDGREPTGGIHKVSIQKWAALFDRCLLDRLDPTTFESYVPLLYPRNPLPPNALADLLLRPRTGNFDSADPRVPLYLQVLLKLRHIDVSSILRALYRYSTFHSHSLTQEHGSGVSTPEPTRWRSSYAVDEVIFWRLMRSVTEGAIRTPNNALDIVTMMSTWMSLFTEAFTVINNDVMGHLQSAPARDEMESTRAAFVALLLVVCENEAVLKALSKPFAKEARRSIAQGSNSFLPTLQNDGIADRMSSFLSKLTEFDPVDKDKQAASADLDELLDSAVGLESLVISEIPVMNSRAGLYIYIHACLAGRPLIDDHAFFTYLTNRYQSDVQSCAIDLILASFDVLANAVFRNEGRPAAHILRSYLINKLPLLLVTLSASMYAPITPEYCITQALSQVDTNAFPTLSSIFDNTGNSNPLTDNVREDFCFACCLHGLVQQSNIEVLLGENTYQTLPAGGKYIKDDLVQDCLTDPEKIQRLLDELENMDGNVGAVCQALTEVLGRLCINKETMPLKALCTQLARNPLSLDVMLLFEKPVTILQPLCELLDGWRYEEDQGEYQPVYEEFGSILLLVLAFAYRYNLSAADMGVRSADSFIAKLLIKGHLSRPVESLTDQEKGHLDGWIHGLFDTESGGLGDELMSSCPPQDFYLLVTTLFHNIVLAYSTGTLTEETLKSGVEYLVDTFLLPSLVTAISFLSDCLWVENVSEQKAVIKILQLILLPNAISNEATPMLSSVLRMVAKPLEHALRTYQRRDPKSQEIEPLLKGLKESIPLSRRTGGADHNELESWAGTPGGGMVIAIKNTIQGLVQWSLQPVMNDNTRSYSHRQVLVGLKTLGAKRVLQVILEEIKHQTETVNRSVIYDVATALVCAPDVTNDAQTPPSHLIGGAEALPAQMQRRLSLRDVLTFEAQDYRKIQKTDEAMAEIVVRLYRGVEAQMAPSQAAAILQTNLSLSLPDGTGDLSDAIAGAGVAADGMGVDLDLSMAGVSGDLGMGSSSAGGASLDLGADADLFGSLAGSADLMDGWDNMDLT